ncbi:MAG: hypothetical protein GX774_17770 [Armatimonadetes bacterium]|jgi:hypothetical protein|nr:hypothetical protein [Armatimonadota bacterium]
MAEQDPLEQTPEAKEWEHRGKRGGGPEAPEGDTEPSNWPGETRARKLRPPDPLPVPPTEGDEGG